ncbi:hypothetical protein RhiJN_06650 [Ceratobasidium sp. AG-Ba]|nr:hypothetical protein RhiJN_06650 [Ceratobasidium sp. AG-Ba]QRW07561.1 hypothetical protein RhiLY_06560 [Ceratobasidium sp. AG-Ba]
MKPPERELRTNEFPYAYFPDHWGPFPIHDIFPIDKQLKPLDVEFFYICTTPSKSTDPIFLGFDDFAPVWPMDPELSEKAIKRRDKFRERAELRALVRVKKMKHLTTEGIERLRDAGADLSETACREGSLVVAVTGKYNNYPIYYPDRGRKSGTLFVQYIHEFHGDIAPSQHRMAERNLHLATIDGRTYIRSMLYFERIKLRCFMVNTHREYRESVPVDERDVEWFITKYMNKYPCAETSIRKPKEYRGAHKHTSEVRHCFVVHAEWLLHHASLSNGPDRVINRKVLDAWAANAPAKREGAARDGRDGWGKWDSQWDRDNIMESHRKESVRLRYFAAQIRQKINDADSGNEGGDEDDDVDMASVHSQEGPKNSVLGRGGKVKGGNYMHAWIHVDQSEDDAGASRFLAEEDELASLDGNDDSSSKRRKSNSGTSLWSRQSASTRPTSSLSRSGWGYQHSSPSFGSRPLASPSLGPSGPRLSQSLDAGPSSSQSLGGESRVGPLRYPTAGSSRLSTVDPGLSGIRQSPVREKSPSLVNIPSDSDAEMADPPPLPVVKRESVAPSIRRSEPFNRSDDEEVIPESDVESVAHSSDSESKYAKKPRPPKYTDEQLARIRLKDLNTQLYEFAPMVFYPIPKPDSWTPWHCDCPPIDMPLSSTQDLSSSYKCKYLIDLRKPSDDVLRLLSNSAEPTDRELLKHLTTKPSMLLLPWDDLATQILKRVVELHWEEHFAAWGVRRSMVFQQRTMSVLAHFEYR